MSAYPNLHLLAYGAGGARLNRSELAVEAADALERLNRTCATCEHFNDEFDVWCHEFGQPVNPHHFCSLWSAPEINPAHDKEKS